MVSAWSMGTAKKGQYAKTTPMETPGPGTYNGKNGRFSSPHYSMKGRYRSNSVSNTPGPGNYNIQSTIKEGPKYHIGSRSFIGSSMTKEIPGPGQYTPARMIKSPSYSFGSRPASAHVDRNPGPGAYSLSASYDRLPGSIIGREERNTGLQGSGRIPGPGTYSLNSPTTQNFGPKYGFGTGTRGGMHLSKAFTNPGPGSYDAKVIIGNDGPKKSMTSRRPDSASAAGRDTPGPGTYELRVVQNAPAYRLGSSQRSFLSKEALNMPGAGTYNPNDRAVRPLSPGWRLGTGKRDTASPNSSPGPGNYNIPSRLQEGPMYGISGRSSTQKLDNKPGPGAYNPSTSYVKPQSPAYGLGSGPKGSVDFTTRKDVPGPGIYDLKSQLQGPKYGFGTGARTSAGRDDVPGPGFYRIPCTIADVPKYLIPNETQFKFV